MEYKIAKRRKRGREGYALLGRVIDRFMAAHCERVPASNPMGYVPRWDDEQNRRMLGYLCELRSLIKNNEVYARTAEGSL